MNEAAPLTYAHYEVLSRLGQGAMGVVYLARDRRIGRYVALKVVRPREFENVNEAKEFFARLQREAELSGRLVHPNIATLYEVGYEGRLISYLAIEYVQGVTLQERLRSRVPLSIDESLHVAADVLRGLAHAHQQGVIHRDIKPANIIVQPDGTAKILDFGIARLEDSSLTLDGSFVGTPHYMSPEQVRQLPITPRVDLFSLGVVLFEMLTATKPFSGDSFTTVMYSVMQAPLPDLTLLRSDAPAWLRDYVEHLVAKEPSDRVVSAAAALEELERLGAQSQAPPQPAVAEPSPPRETVAALPAARSLRVPGGVAVAATALPLVALVAWSSWAMAQARRPIEPRHTPSELRLFTERSASLRAARELVAREEWPAAQAAYERHVATYPTSYAAREELVLLTTRLAAATAVVTEAGAPSRDQRSAAAAEDKKPGFLRTLGQRARRIFKRGE